jgi:anti-sigma factor RsiW
MQLDRNRHASDETLEQYSVGSLEESAAENLEEHLLVCPECQRRLEETDAFVAAMRGAARSLEGQEESRRRFWSRVSGVFTFRRLSWAMGAAAVALLAVAVRVSLNPPHSSPPYALVLQASRGGEAGLAPAGRKLDLGLDTSGLPAVTGYQVEIVDAQGIRVARPGAQLTPGRVRVLMAKGLGAGTYFVRLYAPSGELLREYALEVK